MTWKPGESGNPGGRGTEKAFANALRAVLNEEDPKHKRRKLLQVAEVVYQRSIAGEAWATALIADRLDGKPATEATITHRHEAPAELTDAQLTERLAELRARDTKPTHTH